MKRATGLLFCAIAAFAGPAASGEAASPEDDPVLLASLAEDGTAIFWGAETDGSFLPPTFAASARFRAGEAASTALTNAIRLVAAEGVFDIPARAFAGLPELRCVILPRAVNRADRSVGPGAFADCPALESVVFVRPESIRVAEDAFAGCATNLVAFVLDREDNGTSAWPDGPIPVVRGLGLGGERFAQGRVQGDWDVLSGTARYIGLRIDRDFAYLIRPDGTARLLRGLAPGARRPLELDGAPVARDEGDDASFPTEGGRLIEGPFVYRVTRHPRLANGAPAAKLVAYAGTNEVVSLPDTLGGLPLVIVEEAFAGTPVRGVRLPPTIAYFRHQRLGENTRIAAIWCDGTPPGGVGWLGWERIRFYRAGADIEEPIGAGSPRILPADTDVEAVLARGPSGPPVCGLFEYVPLAGGRGAVVTGLAMRPIGDSVSIPRTLGGLPVVGIAAGAFATHGTGSPTRTLFGRSQDGYAMPDDPNGIPFSVPLAVSVPEGVRRIGARAFSGFAPMESLALPESLEEIGREAFSCCPLLRSVRIPSGVREIPVGAFADCVSLETVRLDGPVERIEPFAFAACPALQSVSVRPDPVPDVDPWAFLGSPSARLAPEPEKPSRVSGEDAAARPRSR